MEAIDRAINAIERSVHGLEKIRTPAESIKSTSEKILDRVRIEQAELEWQLGTLRQKLAGLRGAEG